MKALCGFTLIILMIIPAVLPAEGPFPSKVLGNGLEVIVVENHTVPLVTIEILFRNGAFIESPEENGLTNLYDNLFFKANKILSTQASYLARVRELGMITGASTREEWVHFHATLPSDSLGAGLEFMQQVVEFPMFNIDEMAREKELILEQMDRQAANPGAQLNRAVQQKLWGSTFSRKDYQGDRQVIREATLEQMLLMHERYGLPNNAALLVAGDVSPKDVFRLARKQFGGWEDGPDPSRTNPIPPMIPLAANVDTIVTQPVTTARLTLAWQGPSVTADVKGTFAADVLSLILSQKTSSFQKNLIAAGVLEADMFYLTQKYVGPIFINAACRPDKLRAAHEALLAEIESFAEPEYFSDKQLANAKTLLEVDAIYKRDEASYFVHELGFWWAIAGLDYYRGYLDNLRAVSRADIVNYVNRYIIGQPRVTAVMVDRQSQQELNLAPGSLLP